MSTINNASARVPTTITFSTASQSLTPPLATSEIGTNNLRHVKFDLSNARRARVSIAVTATTTSGSARLEYSLNDSSWSSVDGSGGPTVSIATTGTKDTGWVNITPTAQVDNVYLRMVTQGGDGVGTCTLGSIIAMFD